jgi:hypothetical protein
MLSGSEHLDENVEDALAGYLVKDSHTPSQTDLVDGPNVVKHDVAIRALEPDRDAAWIGAAPGCHRCNDYGAQVTIHFVRRDHYTGTRFADLTAACGVEIHQVNLKTRDPQASGHSHSVASNSVGNSGSSKASSRAFAICSNAVSHP